MAYKNKRLHLSFNPTWSAQVILALYLSLHHKLRIVWQRPTRTGKQKRKYDLRKKYHTVRVAGNTCIRNMNSVERRASRARRRAPPWRRDRPCRKRRRRAGFRVYEKRPTRRGSPRRHAKRSRARQDANPKRRHAMARYRMGSSPVARRRLNYHQRLVRTLGPYLHAHRLRASGTGNGHFDFRNAAARTVQVLEVSYRFREVQFPIMDQDGCVRFSISGL